MVLLLQVLKASVERAMCARPPEEVWQQLPARMLTNIKSIANSASTTEMQARAGRGASRVQQEHRDVVTFILRFFQVWPLHLLGLQHAQHQYLPAAQQAQPVYMRSIHMAARHPVWGYHSTSS